MPRKPRHPCGYPGCPELTERQYCPAHEKIVSSQYNRYGRTPEIRRITGYLVGTLDRFNDGKRAEERDRVKHSIGGSDERLV